LVLHTKEVDN